MVLKDPVIDYDGIVFGTREGSIVLEQFNHTKKPYKNSPEVPFQPSNMFHIVTVHLTRDGMLSSPDVSEAVLLDPLVYAENLSKSGIMGWVVKKTENSPKFINKIVKELSEHSVNSTSNNSK